MLRSHRLRLVLAAMSVTLGCTKALPPGRVPAPAPFDPGAYQMPVAPTSDVMWRAKQLDARLLDAIAPLGDGAANAATWWRELVDDGPRSAEAKALAARAVVRDVAGEPRRIVAWEEPLVQEARATADQASMSFHPASGPVPDLTGKSDPPGHLMIQIATAWMAHGLESQDPAVARDDFRRMIRLGRLLLQDDASVVQVIIGMRILRDGLQALHDRARRDGNRDEQLLVALAQLDRQKVSSWESGRTGSLYVPGDIDLADPSARLNVSRSVMDRLEAALAQSTVRRWKLLSLQVLQAVALRGDSGSAARATALLHRATADADPWVAGAASKAIAGENASAVMQAVLGPDTR